MMGTKISFLSLLRHLWQNKGCLCRNPLTEGSILKEQLENEIVLDTLQRGALQ